MNKINRNIRFTSSKTKADIAEKDAKVAIDDFIGREYGLFADECNVKKVRTGCDYTVTKKGEKEPLCYIEVKGSKEVGLSAAQLAFSEKYSGKYFVFRYGNPMGIFSGLKIERY
jgi:hypothetical protein